jgi:hypothetical protein
VYSGKDIGQRRYGCGYKQSRGEERMTHKNMDLPMNKTG